jgi:drug/metabolite transporter (DMT)-like permease
LFTGNAGTYYAGLETVPAALAGVLVYTYPVIVALLSLRFATRLPGRRPWIALVLAVTGSAAMHRTRRHRPMTPPSRPR